MFTLVSLHKRTLHQVLASTFHKHQFPQTQYFLQTSCAEFSSGLFFDTNWYIGNASGRLFSLVRVIVTSLSLFFFFKYHPPGNSLFPLLSQCVGKLKPWRPFAELCKRITLLFYSLSTDTKSAHMGQEDQQREVLTFLRMQKEHGEN